MSALNREQVAHLAHLARLAITDEEADRYANQLSGVVHYVEQLQTIDTKEVQPEQGVTGLHNVLASDQPRTEGDPLAVSQEALLSGAPLTSGDFVEVRAVLGGVEAS